MHLLARRACILVDFIEQAGVIATMLNELYHGPV